MILIHDKELKILKKSVVVIERYKRDFVLLLVDGASFLLICLTLVF